MPRKNPTTELQAEEAATVSSPLRRSSRITTSSPAPAKLTGTRRASHTETSSTPKPVTRTKRLSFSQDNETDKENEVKATPRGKRTSTLIEENKKEPTSPAKKSNTKSRGASVSPTSQDKDVPKKTRGRRSSTASEPDVKDIATTRRNVPKETEEPVQKPVRGRRSSVTEKTTESDDKEDTKKKPVRGRRSSVQEPTDEETEEVKPKATRGRRSSTSDKDKEGKEEKKPVKRSRKASTEEETPPEVPQKVPKTPGKSKRRLSTTETAANLEPIEEVEPHTSKTKDDEVGKELHVTLTPLKKPKAVSDPNLSIISETSFSEDVVDAKLDSELSDVSNTNKPEKKLEEKPSHSNKDDSKSSSKAENKIEEEEAASEEKRELKKDLEENASENNPLKKTNDKEPGKEHISVKTVKEMKTEVVDSAKVKEQSLTEDQAMSKEPDKEPIFEKNVKEIKTEVVDSSKAREQSPSTEDQARSEKLVEEHTFEKNVKEVEAEVTESTKVREQSPSSEDQAMNEKLDKEHTSENEVKVMATDAVDSSKTGEVSASTEDVTMKLENTNHTSDTETTEKRSENTASLSESPKKQDASKVETVEDKYAVESEGTKNEASTSEEEKDTKIDLELQLPIKNNASEESVIKTETHELETAILSPKIEKVAPHIESSRIMEKSESLPTDVPVEGDKNAVFASPKLLSPRKRKLEKDAGTTNSPKISKVDMSLNEEATITADSSVIERALLDDTDGIDSSITLSLPEDEIKLLLSDDDEECSSGKVKSTHSGKPSKKNEDVKEDSKNPYSDDPDISMGSDGSFRFHLNVSVPIDVTKDELNDSQTSNEENKSSAVSSAQKIPDSTEMTPNPTLKDPSKDQEVKNEQKKSFDEPMEVDDEKVLDNEESGKKGENSQEKQLDNEITQKKDIIEGSVVVSTKNEETLDESKKTGENNVTEESEDRSQTEVPLEESVEFKNENSGQGFNVESKDIPWTLHKSVETTVQNEVDTKESANSEVAKEVNTENEETKSKSTPELNGISKIAYNDKIVETAEAKDQKLKQSGDEKPIEDLPNVKEDKLVEESNAEKQIEQSDFPLVVPKSAPDEGERSPTEDKIESGISKINDTAEENEEVCAEEKTAIANRNIISPDKNDASVESCSVLSSERIAGDIDTVEITKITEDKSQNTPEGSVSNAEKTTEIVDPDSRIKSSNEEKTLNKSDNFEEDVILDNNAAKTEELDVVAVKSAREAEKTNDISNKMEYLPKIAKTSEHVNTSKLGSIEDNTEKVNSSMEIVTEMFEGDKDPNNLVEVSLQTYPKTVEPMADNVENEDKSGRKEAMAPETAKTEIIGAENLKNDDPECVGHTDEVSETSDKTKETHVISGTEMIGNDGIESEKNVGQEAEVLDKTEIIGKDSIESEENVGQEAEVLDRTEPKNSESSIMETAVKASDLESVKPDDVRPETNNEEIPSKDISCGSQEMTEPKNGETLPETICSRSPEKDIDQSTKKIIPDITISNDQIFKEKSEVVLEENTNSLASDDSGVSKDIVNEEDTELSCGSPSKSKSEISSEVEPNILVSEFFVVNQVTETVVESEGSYTEKVSIVNELTVKIAENEEIAEDANRSCSSAKISPDAKEKSSSSNKIDDVVFPIETITVGETKVISKKKKKSPRSSLRLSVDLEDKNAKKSSSQKYQVDDEQNIKDMPIPARKSKPDKGSAVLKKKKSKTAETTSPSQISEADNAQDMEEILDDSINMATSTFVSKGTGVSKKEKSDSLLYQISHDEQKKSKDELNEESQSFEATVSKKRASKVHVEASKKRRSRGSSIQPKNEEEHHTSETMEEIRADLVGSTLVSEKSPTKNKEKSASTKKRSSMQISVEHPDYRSVEEEKANLVENILISPEKLATKNKELSSSAKKKPHRSSLQISNEDPKYRSVEEEKADLVDNPLILSEEGVTKKKEMSTSTKKKSRRSSLQVSNVEEVTSLSSQNSETFGKLKKKSELSPGNQTERKKSKKKLRSSLIESSFKVDVVDTDKDLELSVDNTEEETNLFTAIAEALEASAKKKRKSKTPILNKKLKKKSKVQNDDLESSNNCQEKGPEEQLDNESNLTTQTLEKLSKFPNLNDIGGKLKKRLRVQNEDLESLQNGQDQVGDGNDVAKKMKKSLRIDDEILNSSNNVPEKGSEDQINDGNDLSTLEKSTKKKKAKLTHPSDTEPKKTKESKIMNKIDCSTHQSIEGKTFEDQSLKKKSNLDNIEAVSDKDKEIPKLDIKSLALPKAKLEELEDFAHSKLDAYLKSKMEEFDNERSYESDSYDDSEDSDEENDFICTMAEEGEEDTPSEGSNDIIDEGESLHSSDTEELTDDSYENDSFVCDDEEHELLSGEEFDLNSQEHDKKKKSRIIPLGDSEEDTDVILFKKKEKKPKEVKPKKKSRIIVISDSEEEKVATETEGKVRTESEENLSKANEENTTISEGETTHASNESIEAILPQESTDDAKPKKPTIKILEQIILTDSTETDSPLQAKNVDESFELPDESHKVKRRRGKQKTDTSTTGLPRDRKRKSEDNSSELSSATEEKRRKTDSYLDSSQLTSVSDADFKRKKGKKRHSSISIHENLKVEEIQDASLSERINLIVDTFCNTVKKGEISLNLSLEYADKSSSEQEQSPSSDDQNDDVFEEDRSDEEERRMMYLNKNKSESSEEFLNTPRRLSITADNIEDYLEEDSDMSKKRKSKSLECLDRISPKKKKKVAKEGSTKRKRSRRWNKNKEKLIGTSNNEETYNLVDQLISEQKKTAMRKIKPTIVTSNMNSSWLSEEVCLKPSTSLVSKEDKDKFKAKTFHEKDFRNRMLYDSSRVKRVETKALLKKKGYV